MRRVELVCSLGGQDAIEVGGYRYVACPRARCTSRVAGRLCLVRSPERDAETRAMLAQRWPTPREWEPHRWLSTSAPA